MAEYGRCATIKIARPDTPEGYMIINAADYRSDLPQWMYDEGHAYNPAVWVPYIEQPLKAPSHPATEEAGAMEPASATSAPRHAGAGRHSITEEKK